MYKKLTQENRWWSSQASTTSKKNELKLVASKRETSKITAIATLLAARAIRFVGWLTAAWAWAFTAELVRVVGGGKRSLRRHEFESIELKRGGFGDVF